MMAKPSKILLVDDHSLIREGIKSAIEHEEEGYMVIEAYSCKEALMKVQSEKPDLVVMDISLGDGNGMDLAEDLIRMNSHMKIIMLSMYDDYDYISRCLEIGVSGYVLKREGHEIVEGLRQVFGGKTYYSTGVRDLIIHQYAQAKRDKPRQSEPISLTAREKEVIELVVKGLTSNEIADKLFISTRTVDTHRSNIMKKLKVKNSISLINKIKELDILD